MKKFFFVLTFGLLLLLSPYSVHAAEISCGETVSSADSMGATCSCGSFVLIESKTLCCGTADTSESDGCAVQSSTTSTSTTSVSSAFSTFNKAIFGDAGPNTILTTPRGIISRLLPYLFSAAGLILFVMILWSGFEMLSGAANPKSQDAGRQRLTNALVGFALLFISYWLARLVGIIFGINILG